MADFNGNPRIRFAFQELHGSATQDDLSGNKPPLLDFTYQFYNPFGNKFS